MRGPLPAVLTSVLFAALCAADEISPRKGDSVQGKVRAISDRSLLFQQEDGMLQRLYWLEDLDEILYTCDEGKEILRYRIGWIPPSGAVQLPKPSYSLPDLAYEEDRVLEVLPGYRLRLASGRIVRLAGVEPIEGPEGLAHLRGRLRGRDIKVSFTDLPEGPRGEMGVYVYCEGDLVNARLLEKGMARVGEDLEEEPFGDLFPLLERHAKIKENGVWAMGEYEEGAAPAHSSWRLGSGGSAPPAPTPRPSRARTTRTPPRPSKR